MTTGQTKKRSTAGKTERRGPLGESLKELRSRAARILDALQAAYPDAHIPLNYETPLELLVATILSAQCTDARVNEVTADLFKKYRTASDWADAAADVLEEEVRSTGFFRSKAKAIRESTRDILDRFDGRVPDTLEELTSLRGVGRKTANVVLAHAFDKQGVIVDTHFIRLSRRMGLTAEFDPVKIEFDLMEVIPEEQWSPFSLMLTWHGRVVCYARKPECESCPVMGDCPAFETRGEIAWKVKTPAWKKKAASGKGAGRVARRAATGKRGKKRSAGGKGAGRAARRAATGKREKTKARPGAPRKKKRAKRRGT